MTAGRSATVASRGNVILVPFPFAELTAHKARPAVVVSGPGFFRAEGKIMVAAITSNVRAHTGPTNLIVTRWRDCGLLKPSVITSWLATLAPDVVLMRIGALKGKQLRALENCLRATLQL